MGVIWPSDFPAADPRGLAIWPTLLVEADVNSNERLAGEKPLSTLNSKCLRPYFAQRLQQGMIRARYRLCSLQERREIDDWVAAGNRFAVAKGDWGRVWRRWIREVELIENFVCALRG